MTSALLSPTPKSATAFLIFRVEQKFFFHRERLEMSIYYNNTLEQSIRKPDLTHTKKMLVTENRTKDKCKSAVSRSCDNDQHSTSVCTVVDIGR